MQPDGQIWPVAFFFNQKNVIIYFGCAGSSYCADFSLFAMSGVGGMLFFVVVCQLLTGVAFLVAEHWL